MPLIFSNTQFYNSLCERVNGKDLASAIDKIRPRLKRFTIPYSYAIRKDGSSWRSLGIMHPLHQLNVCSFYENYRSTMLFCCSRSKFSIRYPYTPSPIHVESIKTATEDADEGNEVDVEPTFAEGDAPIVRSYYQYRGYSIAGRFFESREFIRLEKRFSCLRRLDVSRCFDSIYTHTVAWAVKGKRIAKAAADAGSSSFEESLDKLMQHMNYNETNGILVGPEVSRIFAEIILQDIDADLLSLLSSRGYEYAWDFDVRRYVDDYFIYANSPFVLDKIEELLKGFLEKYKLWVNESKREDSGRPFITPISVARRELRLEFRKLSTVLRSLQPSADKDEIGRRVRELRDDIGEMRLIVARSGVRFNTVSGWLLGSIKASIKRLAELQPNWKQNDLDGQFSSIITALLELAFYIVSLDLRVQTTFSLGQIILLLMPSIEKAEEHNRDQLKHVLSDELIGLVRHLSSKGIYNEDASRSAIELYNILICGAHFCGKDFLNSKSVINAIEALSSPEWVEYFAFITAKFCLLRHQDRFDALIAKLNGGVEARLLGCSAAEALQNAETYLLLCDFISSTDVEEYRKRAVFDKIFGGTISKSAMAQLASRVRFVDWSGLQIPHLLQRKVLQPAYA